MDIRKFWEENDIYKFDEKNKGEVFSIDTPPPTVSGNLHIGHIFSYTQAEIIARYKRMQGYNVFYPFGFDDNGLPTERLVEKVEGIRAKDIPRSEFINRCFKISEKYEEEFKELWKSLGFSVDWSLEYRTIDPEVQKISQKSFLDLVKVNKAYIKESPVLWCTNCQTSIAQAELDTKDIDTTFNYVVFMVSDKPLIVATTRPELLYACVSLFVNPNDDRYKSYIGKTATVPLYNFEIPILADERVSIEKGSGAVMCATFGDTTDVDWYQEYKLPYKRVILPNGFIEDTVPFISGLSILNSRMEIIKLLKEKDLLVKSDLLIHTVSVHERCSHEIEIIPSKQWYIDILNDKESFLKAADEINWYPKSMKNKYIDWVSNLKWDWCISRQRYFGVPFPVWYCKSCGKPIFAEISDLPVNPMETNPNKTCSCGCSEFAPETAIFDTWMTSSLTPFINSKKYEVFPMTMRTQAHEIIRTWAFYTIVKSLYHKNQIPWKNIMVCGFVVDENRGKLSKSKNNSSLSPSSLIETYSADCLRYWSANSRLGTDSIFKVKELLSAKRFITKLQNASKFAISHLKDFDKTSPVRLLPVDRWIMERTNETIIMAKKNLNEYEISLARQKIDDLFWKDFCDYYIEIVKDRLYKPEIHGYDERKSSQYAIYYSLFNILKLYAIYVPFITENIYQDFFRKHEEKISIHQHLWENPKSFDIDLLSFGEQLKETIFNMRKYKSQNNLSLKTEIDKIDIRTEKKFMNWFKETEKDIKACSFAKIININQIFS